MSSSEPEHERIARARRAASSARTERARSDFLMHKAVTELSPEAMFTISEGVVTVESGSAPSTEDIERKMKEISDRTAVQRLREARNEALAKSDWKILLAVEKREDVDETWAEYRQALRDLPSQLERDEQGNLLTRVPSPPE